MAGSIAQFRALLKKDPTTAALIVPSSRFEICMDLNGDGKADFAASGLASSLVRNSK